MSIWEKKEESRRGRSATCGGQGGRKGVGRGREERRVRLHVDLPKEHRLDLDLNLNPLLDACLQHWRLKPCCLKL